MDLNSLITVGGLSLAVANTWTANQSIDDDTLLRLGADGDNVLVNRSTSLAADAELSNVIVGTSDHQGVAANSLILSNITQNGDILGLINNAGNSLEWLLVDASALDIHYGFGGIGSHIFYGAAGSESMRVEGGIVFIGDGTTTSSGPMTRGIDLDLVGNSGLVAAFRDSTNVATGLTTGPWGTDVESV